MKKYRVSWNASPNTCGTDHSLELDTIDKVMLEIEEHMTSHYASIRVFDTKLDDFVFWKDCMEKPYINLLKPENHFRDLRTTDRKAHYEVTQ